MTTLLPDEIAAALDAYCDQHDYFTINDFLASYAALPNIEAHRTAIGRWLRLSGYVRGYIRETSLAQPMPATADEVSLRAAIEPLVATTSQLEISSLLARLRLQNAGPEAYRAIESILRQLGFVEVRRKMQGGRFDHVWQRGA